MKVAIIGSGNYDSLEFNLNEALTHKGHESSIFDIHDKYLFRKFGKYAYQLDWMGRRFFDSYDRKVFNKLFEKVIVYKPDLVIGVYRFIHPSFIDRIKKNKIKAIHINPDQLTTLEFQQIFASNYDLYFTKDPYIERFMSLNMGLNVKLYSEAFNQRIHKKPEIDKKQIEEEVGIDVMTYGTMYPYRCRMLNKLVDEGINLKLYGVRPNRFYDQSLNQSYVNKYITGQEKTRLLYGSKIVFNNMHYAEIESVNNRFFEANGSGAFQLSDYRPILHELLPVDPELVSFKSIDEGVNKVKYYLEHPIERFEIAQKVYDHFLANYTYDHLIDYILKSI